LDDEYHEIRGREPVDSNLLATRYLETLVDPIQINGPSLRRKVQKYLFFSFLKFPSKFKLKKKKELRILTKLPIFQI